ncbi:TPA: outer membrane beta-barrel protein [Salmonella enterica]|nr:outer membrane beta-barrel protein [Salmonella enterica]
MNKKGFTCSAGVQYNPVKNIALTVGYEGSSFSSVDGSGSENTDGFNISVGYRF